MKLIADSDFLIALYKPLDSNHQKAVDLYKRIQNKYKLTALNIVFQESTTVISKHIGMDNAKKFYQLISKMVGEQVFMNNELEKDTWKLFLKQTKKGTSFIDCANLAFCQKYKLDGILSFDDFYPKEVVFS